ncbi:MAG: DUF4440 domain-containing protein [Gammaproteobacteria bacterium]|nr:DUF4440 domain-containing protein [Gammaproteobacteria bacterium]
MKKLPGLVIVALLSLPAMAEHHSEENADLYAAIHAFDNAYATNDTDTYFGYYAEDATVFFSGARQDLSAYAESWPQLMEAGGGVEKNEMSDLKVQVMPGGNVAVSTAFIDNVTRSPDGSKSSIRAFETDVWQKIDGEWKVISLHYTELPAEE